MNFHKHCVKVLLTIFAAVLCLTGCQERESHLTELPSLPDYNQYFTLADYNSLTYSVNDDYIITDDAVESAMRSILSSTAEIMDITDRGAESGDILTIKYDGTIDGQAFTGGSTSDDGTTIILGSAGYVEGFEDQLIGAKTNSTVSVTVTFPDNFGKTQLNGKTAVFDVTILSIKNRVFPEITDDLVRENTSYSTITALKDAIRSELQTKADSAKIESYGNELLSTLTKNSTFTSYPDNVIDDMVDPLIFDAEQQAMFSSISVDEYIAQKYDAKNVEEYRNILTNQAKTYINLKMIICEIARRENITVSLDEFNTYRTDFAKQHNFIDLRSLNKYYDDADILILCLETPVKTWLVEHATGSEN